MPAFYESEFSIFQQFTDLVVEECLEKILEYHMDSEGRRLCARYETKDFCVDFKDSVRSSVRMALDCALDHPHLMAEPDSFNDIESLAERIAVHNYKAHGKDGFEVNTCPSCGAFMNISMKREYYMQ